MSADEDVGSVLRYYPLRDPAHSNGSAQKGAEDPAGFESNGDHSRQSQNRQDQPRDAEQAEVLQLVTNVPERGEEAEEREPEQHRRLMNCEGVEPESPRKPMNPYIHGGATTPARLLGGVCMVHLLTSAWTTRVDATVALGRQRAASGPLGTSGRSSRSSRPCVQTWIIVDHQDHQLPGARPPRGGAFSKPRPGGWAAALRPTSGAGWWARRQSSAGDSRVQTG
jgi:hypothetical protein